MNNPAAYRNRLGGAYIAWQALFFGIPMLILLFTSLKRYHLGLPQEGFSLANYQEVLTASTFPRALLRSVLLALGVAALATLLALITVLGAWCIQGARLRHAVLLGCAVMFFAGVIPRTHAFEFLLSSHGFLGPVWGFLGMTQRSVLYSMPGVVLGYLPLLLPLGIAVLAVARHDLPEVYLQAGEDLGAGWFAVQRRIVVPLMRPGVIVAFLLSFLFVIGDVVVVDLIGGSQVYTVASQILDYVKIDDWGSAAAASVYFLTAVILTIAGATYALLGILR